MRHVISLTIVLLALLRIGRALRNITINAESDLSTEYNQFLAKNEAKLLVFDHVIIESIAEDSFTEYTNLQIFYFDKNGIIEIPENLFKFNTEIRFLSILNNLLTTLHPNTFAALKSVGVISLSQNHLSAIDENLFRNNEKLFALGLQNNFITTIHPRTFEKLFALRMLFLSNNRLTTLQDNLFTHNPKLEKIYLARNFLKVLSSSALFANNPELNHVNLNENILQRLDFNVFSTNSKLETIFLRKNGLPELVNYEHTKQTLPKLKKINFHFNNFNCTYFEKLVAHFDSSNVSMKIAFDPSSSASLDDFQESAPCILDEDYDYSRRKSYWDVYEPQETIEIFKKKLYELEPPPDSSRMITKRFEEMLEDLKHCEDGGHVEGYKLKIMDSCDYYRN